MSEYQWVHFLALDRLLDDQQLRFMEKQSSRAKITRGEFSNEYHYGDFRGDALEMLRRGYDVHVQFTNYGTRLLLFRFHGGLPWEWETLERYDATGAIYWRSDVKGTGGALEFYPKVDPESYDYYEGDLAELLPRVAPLRNAMMLGDLRPLYVMWLATTHDQDAIEPPVPAGLGQLDDSLAALAEFYEVPRDLIAAAAKDSGPLPKSSDLRRQAYAYVATRNERDVRQIALRMLSDPSGSERLQILEQMRREIGVLPWPTATPSRTLGQLSEQARRAGNQRQRREEAERLKKRNKRLAMIAADPENTIAKIKSLVEEQNSQSYQAAAEMLGELRDALGPKGHRAEQLAENLRKKYPTRNVLVSELRKAGFLPKKQRIR